MPQERLHHEALIETARLELDRAHRAVLAIAAAEIRRGLTLAAAALNEAVADGLEPAGTPGHDMMSFVLETIALAQTDLDNGALAEAAKLIEAARKHLNA